MDSNVFISKIEIYNIKESLENALKNHQVSISFFDKDGTESVLLSSIMSIDNANKYQHNLLKLLKCKNLIELKYSPFPTNLTTVFDLNDASRIIGLECKNGIILKNEIKFY